jgi:hypothetical protein
MALRWLGIYTLALSVFWVCVFTFINIINPNFFEPLQGLPERLLPPAVEQLAALLN